MAPVQAVTPSMGHPNNASMLTMKRRLLIKRKQRLLFCILRNWILILLVFVALIAVILMLIMLLQPCSVVIIPLDTTIVDTLQTRNILETHSCRVKTGNSNESFEPVCGKFTKEIKVFRCSDPLCFDTNNQTTRDRTACVRSNCSEKKCIHDDSSLYRDTYVASIDGDVRNDQVCLRYAVTCSQTRQTDCIASITCQSVLDQQTTTKQYCENITKTYCKSPITNNIYEPTKAGCKQEQVCSVCVMNNDNNVKHPLPCRPGLSTVRRTVVPLNSSCETLKTQSDFDALLLFDFSGSLFCKRPRVRLQALLVVE